MIGAIIQGISLAATVAGAVGKQANAARVSEDLAKETAKGFKRGQTMRTKNTGYAGKNLVNAMTGRGSYFG